MVKEFSSTGGFGTSSKRFFGHCWLKYAVFLKNKTCYLESGVIKLNIVQETQIDSCYKTPFPQRNAAG